MDGDKVIISSVTGEPSYNYKNFSGTQTSNYQVTLDNNIIKRNVNSVLRDFIGGIGGRMVLPYEKRSWTAAQLAPFINLPYTTTTSVMSNSDCRGFSYIIFIWEYSKTSTWPNAGTISFQYKNNGIFYPVSNSVSGPLHYGIFGGGGSVGKTETKVTMVCSSDLSQINLTMTRTPYSQTQSTITLLNDIVKLDAYFIR